MSPLSVGMLGGLLFGGIAVVSMLPMSFPDKRAALMAAFLNRFAIGFTIGAADLSWPGWAVGLAFGLLLSVPDAIITRAWAPYRSVASWYLWRLGDEEPSNWA